MVHAFGQLVKAALIAVFHLHGQRILRLGLSLRPIAAARSQEQDGRKQGRCPFLLLFFHRSLLYMPKTCLPILVMMVLDQIHLLVAVLGFQ